MHLVKPLIDEHIPEAINLRQQLHQIPELKYEEFKTSALIADILKSYGITAQTGIAKTGIVATIDSGKPGKTVALRADIDALPIQEKTELPYQSQHPNTMHACGHDGHTATLLLVARVLEKIKHSFTGKIKLIFQPAEEGGKGSLAMINEGVLDNVDAIFGYHNWPSLAIGKMGTRTGAILAGSGRFEILLHGKVAHTSMPEHAVNPILVGAQIISALEKQYLNLKSQSAIINAIRFESGEMKGGMTDSAKIVVIYYTESHTVLARVKAEIERLAEEITKKYSATFELKLLEFHTPTINTKNEADLVLSAAKNILPADHVIEFEKCMTAAEDFSEYLSRIPGCFFLVGAGENTPNVHTAQFDFPDEIIPIAASVMIETALRYLQLSAT